MYNKDFMYDSNESQCDKDGQKDPELTQEEVKSILKNITCSFRKTIDKRNPDIDFSKTSPFWSAKPYTYSVEDLLTYFYCHTRCTIETMIVMMIYVDRIIAKHEDILSMNTIEKLVFSTLVVAIKYDEPTFFSDSCYGRLINITSKEVNQLCIDVFRELNFIACGVSQKVFERYKKKLLDHNIKKECDYCSKKKPKK